MADNFFLPDDGREKKRKPGQGTKRKAPNGSAGPPRKKGKTIENEELESHSESDEFRVEYEEKEESGDEDPFKHETAEEKRIRLARGYLEKLSREGVHEDGAEDHVEKRLQQDAIRETGRYRLEVASRLSGITVDSATFRQHRKHELPPTCVAITSDETLVFSGSKDCTIVKWDLEADVRTQLPGKRGDKTVKGHHDQVLAVALSDDGRFLASGGRDNKLRLWDTRTNALIETLEGHRGAVSALAFRSKTRQLFSGGHDRVVKVWDIDSMAYQETLFGHESEVNGLDSLSQERAVSCGTDRSVRLWKIVEQTQLVFRGHKASASIDCIAMLNEQTFVTGAQDGGVAVWATAKKKPSCFVPRAHGPGAPWISALASVRYSDLIASGSSDGAIRLWRVGQHYKELVPVLDVPMAGFVNGLQFSRTGRFLVAAVGQEHRLGRWSRMKDARNRVVLIPLPLDTANIDVADDV